MLPLPSFNSYGESTNNKGKSPKKTDKAKVFQFDRSVFYTPTDERVQIRSSLDIAKFLSTQKRGATPKIGVLIADQANHITKYLFLDPAMSTEELTASLLYEAGKHGQSIFLSSNAKLERGMIKKIQKSLSQFEIKLLDVIEYKQDEEIINNYISFADEGLMESETKYENSENNTNFANDENAREDNAQVPLGSGQEELRGMHENNFGKNLAARLKESAGRNTSQLSRHKREDLEKKAVRDFAKKQDKWIDDLYSLGSPMQGGGNENTLALNPESGIVYKSNNLMNANMLVSQLLEQVMAHNDIFPETAYGIEGITGFDIGATSTPIVEVVLSQTYISNTTQATPQEIEKLMQGKGFEKINDTTFSNGQHEVSDLHPRNVLKDADGNIHVVDDIVRPVKKEDTPNNDTKHREIEVKKKLSIPQNINIEDTTLEDFTSLATEQLLGEKNIANKEINNNFANDENAREDTREARMDNRPAVESSALSETLADEKIRDGISQTIAASNFSGNTRAVLEAEEREELEARGIDPSWDSTAFRKELKNQAKQNDVWLEADYLNDKKQIHNHKTQGTSENDVYENPDGKTLTKLNNLSYVKNGDQARSLNAFIDRLNAHNALFPESAYTIKGFMDNQNGFPSMVLVQDFISSERNASQKEIDEYLTEMGFRKDGVREWSNEHEVWSNGVYELFDARPANVLMGKDGNLYFIDTIPHSVEYLNDNVVDNKNNTNFANDENTEKISSGVAPSAVREAQKGINDSIEENAGDALLARAMERADRSSVQGSRTSKSEQEKLLKDYAKETDSWLNESDISNNSSEKFPSGKEANVYLSQDKTYVTKIVNYDKYSDTPLDFMRNRILLFNELFPNTQYKLLGFTENNKGFAFVVEQPAVKGKELDRLVTSVQTLTEQQDRIAQYLLEKYGMEPAGLDSYSNGEVTLQDIHLKNVMEDANENLYFIDVIPSYNQPNNDIQHRDGDQGTESNPKPAQRKQMASRVKELAEKLNLDNVVVICFHYFVSLT